MNLRLVAVYRFIRSLAITVLTSWSTNVCKVTLKDGEVEIEKEDDDIPED